MKRTTLAFLLREGQILLAMKKRGFGVDKWNGVGGKLEPGESHEQAVIRETKEEIEVDLIGPNKVAILTFQYLDPELAEKWDNECHVYVSSEWDGDPGETEEMRPQWFDISELPLDLMWPDDSIWLPRVLAGEKVRATFYFNANNELVKYVIDAEMELD